VNIITSKGYAHPPPSRKKKTKTKNKQGGVSHCLLAIYIKKYLKAKEEL
jgi:hypothetical protein